MAAPVKNEANSHHVTEYWLLIPQRPAGGPQRRALRSRSGSARVNAAKRSYCFAAAGILSTRTMTLRERLLVGFVVPA